MTKEEIRKAAILIIEDEPSVAEALKIILDDNGYEVATALTGRDGLEQINRQQFDVTISDLRLPDMTGLDVFTQIRQKDPMSKVIIISAHITPEVTAHSMSLGAFGVLTKPFRPSDIVDMISAALTRE